jgi:hypothetical protein
MYFYNRKVSCIDGASVTIILCLHVLIARRILLIVDMLIILSKYRCYTINNRQNRNNSWKSECVLSCNIGWRILVNVIPGLRLGIKYYVKTQNTFWLS